MINNSEAGLGNILYWIPFSATGETDIKRLSEIEEHPFESIYSTKIHWLFGALKTVSFSPVAATPSTYH